MSAKKFIASVLSFALCIGAFTSVNVSAEELRPQVQQEIMARPQIH